MTSSGKCLSVCPNNLTLRARGQLTICALCYVLMMEAKTRTSKSESELIDKLNA